MFDAEVRRKHACELGLQGVRSYDALVPRHRDVKQSRWLTAIWEGMVALGPVGNSGQRAGRAGCFASGQFSQPVARGISQENLCGDGAGCAKGTAGARPASVAAGTDEGWQRSSLKRLPAGVYGQGRGDCWAR